MLYILPVKTLFGNFQEKVLKALAGKIDDFYLAGGTALSLYYFHHRESVDLDFFTRKFDKVRVTETVKLISDSLHKKTKLVAENSGKGKVRVAIYFIAINKDKSLKIDFVEDYLGLIKPPELINGIKVMSLEDIYSRKIYCLTGTAWPEDSIGRKAAIGGRQEAKDFYDMYCLSSIFMRLSDFAFKLGSQAIREALVRWFRTYSRMDIKTGLLELNLKKNIDYADLERHFKKEVDKILEKEVESI